MWTSTCISRPILCNLDILTHSSKPGTTRTIHSLPCHHSAWLAVLKERPDSLVQESARSSRSKRQVDVLLPGHLAIGTSWWHARHLYIRHMLIADRAREIRLLSSSTSWRQQDKATSSSLATLIASNPSGTSPTAPATQSASPAPVTTSPSSSTQIQTFPRASHDEQARKIVIEWNDGEVSRFHNTWLFDHCRCNSCFHPMTKQRRKGLLEVSLNFACVLEISRGIHLLARVIGLNAFPRYTGSGRYPTHLGRTFPSWLVNNLVHPQP